MEREATIETIHAAFQSMRDDLARREAELTAELELKTEESRKRLRECEDEGRSSGGSKRPCTLVTAPWYTLKTLPDGALSKVCALERHLRAVRVPVPQGLRVQSTSHNCAGVVWDPIGGETTEARVTYQLSARPIEGKEEEEEEEHFKECSGTPVGACFIGGLAPEAEYEVRVRAGCCGAWGEWSEAMRARTTRRLEAAGYAGSGWRDCPGRVAAERRYAVSSGGRTATYTPDGNSYCTVLGDAALGAGGVWTWGVRVLRSKNGNGGAIWVGVAPEDVDQDGGENYEHGWYFWCFDSSLWSGPPHNYSDYTEYGGKCSVVEGQVVGVEVDTAAGTISFSVDGGDFKLAYDGVPLDKHLVPAVILGFGGDSVELILN